MLTINIEDRQVLEAVEFAINTYGVVEVEWVDDSFSYSYGSIDGTCYHGNFELIQASITFVLKDFCGSLPTVITDTTIGGCDEEHAGPCKLKCYDKKVKITWNPISFIERDDSLEVTYQGELT